MTLVNAYLIPLTGRVLPGRSTMWLLRSLARIVGIVGVVWAFLAGPQRGWRWLFLLGLLAGGLVTHSFIGQPVPAESTAPF